MWPVGIRVVIAALAGMALDPVRFAVGKAPTALTAAKRKPAPKGTTLLYRLSQAGTVKISLSRVLPGRRSGRRCVAPTRKLRKAKRCQRLVAAGALTRKAVKGANSTAFTGRLGKKALPAGSYRATIVETTPGAAKASAPKTAAFTIVAR
jgi:hypothetical protein